MGKWFAFFALVCLFTQSFGQKAAKVSGCTKECNDAHRICPALKNPAFYEEYKQKHAAELLGQFSKAPLPPKPDCADDFYKIGCRHSCGICTPCHVDSAEVHKIVAAKQTELEAKVDAKIAQLSQQPITCNPCTQVLGTASNGEPACLPKYHQEYKNKGKCSCDCGTGEQEQEKVCYSYEEKNKKCKQVKTFAQNCPQGPPKKTIKCSNKPCIVTQIVEKTAKDKWSESKNTMRYTAYTASGGVCNLGVVEKADGTQRQNNQKDTYAKTEIENPECDVCMKKNEKFAYIEITIGGEDGWKTNWIQVKVNGKNKTFKNTKFIDDKETQKYE